MYAVVFTYNFDEESEVTLFDSFEEATDYLYESFVEERRIEREENGWDVDSLVAVDKTFASISHCGVDSDGEEYEDVCEYRLCSDVRDMRKGEVHEKFSVYPTDLGGRAH